MLHEFITLNRDEIITRCRAKAATRTIAAPGDAQIDCVCEAIVELAVEMNAVDQAGNERMGFLVHELRNHLNTAMVAFEMLQKGNVGTSGATGAILNRSLIGLRDLLDRAMLDAPVTTDVTKKE